MHNRRDALAMLGLALGQAACATQAQSAGAPPGQWLPYRQTLAIDGAGGADT